MDKREQARIIFSKKTLDSKDLYCHTEDFGIYSVNEGEMAMTRTNIHLGLFFFIIKCYSPWTLFSILWKISTYCLENCLSVHAHMCVKVLSHLQILPYKKSEWVYLPKYRFLLFRINLQIFYCEIILYLLFMVLKIDAQAIFNQYIWKECSFE